MTDQKIPELRIGMRNGVWCAAVADQFGWVSLGTAYPLADEDVADWTPLAALPTPPAEASREEIEQCLYAAGGPGHGPLSATVVYPSNGAEALHGEFVITRREATDG